MQEEEERGEGGLIKFPSFGQLVVISDVRTSVGGRLRTKHRDTSEQSLDPISLPDDAQEGDINRLPTIAGVMAIRIPSALIAMARLLP